MLRTFGGRLAHTDAQLERSQILTRTSIGTAEEIGCMVFSVKVFRHDLGRAIFGAGVVGQTSSLAPDFPLFWLQRLVCLAVAFGLPDTGVTAPPFISSIPL